MDVEEDYETDDSNDSDEEALFAYPLPPPEGLGDPATIPEDDVDHALVLLRHRGSRSDTHIVRLQVRRAVRPVMQLTPSRTCDSTTHAPSSGKRESSWPL